MSNINGRIEIIIEDGKVKIETGLDPVVVCQALIRTLGGVSEQKILHVEPKSLLSIFMLLAGIVGGLVLG